MWHDASPPCHTLGVASARNTFSARLRRLHLRVTPQRLLVIEALATGQDHMTADEIMRWAAERSPAINLATIYRALDLLVSVGLVTQIDLGAGAAQFELVGDSPTITLSACPLVRLSASPTAVR